MITILESRAESFQDDGGDTVTSSVVAGPY